MYSKLLKLPQRFSPNFRRIVGNAAWLVADRLFRMGASLLVGVWVARYLGPTQFGLLNYVGALVALFSPLANLGLDNIVIREIVHHPLQKNQILGSAFILRLLGGIAAFFAVLLCSYFLGESQSNLLILGIVASTSIFQAFEVIDLWFQSQTQSRSSVVAKNIAFVISVILKIVCVQLRAPLLVFASLLLIEILLIELGLTISYRLNQQRIRWKFSLEWAKQLVRDSFPLILSGFAIMLYMKIDQVMLGQMLGSASVGIYSVAVRISEVWYFIPTTIAASVQPTLLKAKQANQQDYEQKLQKLFNLMVVSAYLISIFMGFLASPIILSLFGSAYEESIPILVIHIWATIFVFLGVARSTWMIAENFTALQMQTTIIGAIFNILLNFLLIPLYSGLGAAIATVIAYAVAVLLSCAFYDSLRKVGILMVSSLSLVWILRNIRKAMT